MVWDMICPLHSQTPVVFQHTAPDRPYQSQKRASSVRSLALAGWQDVYLACRLSADTQRSSIGQASASSDASSASSVDPEVLRAASEMLRASSSQVRMLAEAERDQAEEAIAAKLLLVSSVHTLIISTSPVLVSWRAP